MQFSQVAERGERQHGNQGHIILSCDNGITKFRLSVCSALSIFIRMLGETTSPQLKMAGVVAQAAFKLSRLSYRSLRDIGLTTHDVEEILRRVRPEGAEDTSSGRKRSAR